MMKNKEWNLFVPVLFVSYLGSFIFVKRERIKTILFAYSLAVLLLYGVGSAVYLRYLTQLMPFWIVLILSGIENFIETKKIKLPKFRLANLFTL
jgi:membrane-anchored protein YejM (alkaline phosphatase superfamily)